MAILPPRVKSGSFCLATHWNMLVDELCRLGKVKGGYNISVTAGAGGYLISHKKDFFWGKLDATGKSVLTDETYWVKEQYVSNNTGDNTTATTFADKTDGLWIIATNIAEIVAGTHSLAASTIVKVWIVKDISDPNDTRYVFNSAV